VCNGVRVDWLLFRELVAAVEPHNEHARLMSALAMIRGPLPEPVLGDVDAAMAAMIHEVAVSTVRRVALASATGDIEHVEWAIRQGLTLIPGAPALQQELARLGRGADSRVLDYG